MMIAEAQVTPSVDRLLKASFAGAKEHRHQFKQATAQLTISIGQPVHEGERLIATLKLINQSFASCKIMIDDSIQWYTLAISKEEAPENLIDQAIIAGDVYLNQHQVIFKSELTIPYKIIRWKDWLDTPLFQKAVISMQEIYKEDEIIREAIQQNVNSFLARYEKKSINANYVRNQAENLCINYLLEECAVMKDLWVKLGCHYEVYPGGRNQAMNATYERYIQPVYPYLLKPIGLRFHRRKKFLNEAEGIA